MEFFDDVWLLYPDIPEQYLMAWLRFHSNRSKKIQYYSEIYFKWIRFSDVRLGKALIQKKIVFFFIDAFP